MNWPSGFGEEEKNVKVYDYDYNNNDRQILIRKTVKSIYLPILSRMQ